jgi:hypothetical protein
MKYFLVSCLTALTLASTPLPATAQAATIPMRRGISVELPPTNNAVTVPNADEEDAVILTVTHDGTMYLGTDLIRPADLAAKVKNDFAGQTKKVLYIKADPVRRTPASSRYSTRYARRASKDSPC